MKLYAVLNERNQIVKQANLFELIHFCKNSSNNLNIAVFRAGESHGQFVASYTKGKQSQAQVGLSVNADVIRRFDG